MSDRSSGQTSPNLFRYATSELSQDAFVCWLLAWADSAHSEGNSVLHMAGRDLLAWMLSTKNVAMPIQTSICIKRQYKSIDVLAIVNNEIAVIIEDKTQTQQHSDQLNRYLSIVNDEKQWQSIIAIYLQTGDQCDYRLVEEASYVLLHRTQLLHILKPHHDKGISSDIFRDFYENLSRLEQLVESYRNVPIANWLGQSPWIGFFKRIKPKLSDANAGWGYVPNASGGFMGLWWSPSNNNTGLYLLLEQRRLCVKYSTRDNTSNLQQARDVTSKLIETTENLPLQFERPRRIRQGNDVTVAVLKGDYYELDSRGVLDIASTIRRLKEVERLLAEAQI